MITATRTISACDLLPESPTWADLTSRLAQAQLPQDASVALPSTIITLCPFRIEGSLSCPTASDGNRIFNVTHPSLRLSCEGPPENCLIDCPETQFSIERGSSFTMQNITMQNNINTMIEVQSLASFTSINSKFQNGLQGAMQGQEDSSIFILQNSLISGNKRKDMLITNQRGAGVATKGNLEIRDSEFANNENESNSGGAVAAGASGRLIVTGSTFRANRAPYAPVIFTEAASALQLEFSNNRACDNVAVLSPADASCQGIYFLSSFECVPFGKGCLDDNNEESCGDVLECITLAVSVILSIITKSLQSMIFGGIRA